MTNFWGLFSSLFVSVPSQIEETFRSVFNPTSHYNISYRQVDTHPAMVPLVTGCSVLGLGISLGYNCGYAINPARDLAPRIFSG